MDESNAGAAPAAPAPEPATPSVPEKPSPTAREAVKNAFASVDREEARPPRPIESQTQPREEPEPKREAPKPKVEAKAPEKPKAEPKTEAKTEPKAADTKPQQSRNPDGKFAPREVAAEGEGAEAAPSPATAPKPTSFPEAPKRFSTDAHSSWKDTPEAVRAETHRAFREMEAGIEKYRPDAEEYAKVKPFADLAKNQGTTLQEAMSRYVGMERKLATDFVGGLELLCQNKGTSLRAVAAQIMGQKPDEVSARQDQTVAGLRQQIAQLQQMVTGVTKTVEQQRTDATQQQVEAFAKQAGHERFEELAQDISFFLKSGRATDLTQAYDLAERLNPAPARTTAAPPPASVPETPTPAAQTRKGSLATHGAPSSGSDPATRKPPSSARDAVRRALAQVG